jgi:hypothetical protein
MPPKKKLKTRIASKKDAALVETMVRVLRNSEKKMTKKEECNGQQQPVDNISSLRRDMTNMQEIFNDRLNRLEDKLGSLRVFADDTRRVVGEHSKTLDERLDQMALSVNATLEKVIII